MQQAKTLRAPAPRAPVRSKAETQPDAAPGGAEGEPKARERILQAATKLFCQYGINAVGVDAVVAEAATAKATLYKTFGSKERLVEAVLEREGAAWRDWFLGELLKGEATPVMRLRRIFPVLREWFGQEHFFGCPFINAVAEHDKKDDRLRQIALAHKKVVLETIAGLAGEAGARDANGVAHQLGVLIDGAIVAAMITEDPNVALLAGQTADLLLAGFAAEAA
ncbi:TetR/AcrR family transcriptional regulator [Xanthobacter autotrophicus DSM 431]|uniref:TetR/AcrR family transcriptional regulator n=1 Tax=Xanthobacter nonsaccharivorans TaxID=3119912 RepID=UPI00372CD864